MFGADVAGNIFLRRPFFLGVVFFPLNLQDADQEAAAAGVSCLAAIGEVWTRFFWWELHMGGNPKIGGKPPKWMVKIMENPIFCMDDLGGKPTIFGNTHIFSVSFSYC